VDPDPSFSSVYLPMIGVSTAALLLGALLGYLPTRRWCGPGTVTIIALGCGASWISSCAGAVPLAMSGAGKRGNAAIAMMAATAVRFAVVLLLTVGLVFGTSIDRTPLVVWVAVSYLWVLPFETAAAVRLVKRFAKTSSP